MPLWSEWMFSKFGFFFFFFFFFLRFIYLFTIDTHRERKREAETQEEGEAGSMPGAWCGTRSRDSRIASWAKGRRQTAEPPRPSLNMLYLNTYIYFFFKKRFIYLFMIERERGRDTGRGRSRLHAGSPMWDSILGLQDHAWTKGRCQTTEPPRDPLPWFFDWAL